MAGVERVTVTLPDDLLRDIDRREKNRSKFVAEAVRHELDHRRRTELHRRCKTPTPKAPCLPSRDWRNGPGACPKKTPRGSLSAALAGRFGGSRAKVG